MKFESYSYIPRLKIPVIFNVLNLGIFPKIVLSVLGIAILIFSPIINPNLLAKAYPITISLELSVKSFPFIILLTIILCIGLVSNLWITLVILAILYISSIFYTIYKNL